MFCFNSHKCQLGVRFLYKPVDLVLGVLLYRPMVKRNVKVKETSLSNSKFLSGKSTRECWLYFFYGKPEGYIFKIVAFIQKQLTSNP